MIPKLVQHVHNITKVEAKAATCEEEAETKSIIIVIFVISTLKMRVLNKKLQKML